MRYAYDTARLVGQRAPDGRGNNLANPDWGATNTTYRRITENSYLDGKGQMATPPGDAPQPRLISDRLMAQPKDSQGRDLDIPNSFGVNEYFQFFGQFLTHDTADTIPGRAGVDPVLMLDGLPVPFVRTDFVLDANGVRQQRIEETSFLDLSTVYGNSAASLDLLRADIVAPDGTRTQSARLLTSDDAENNLPSFNDVAADAGVPLADVRFTLLGTRSPGNGELFARSDARVNQNAALTTQYTLWMREHNYQADRLAAANPGWTQEQVFDTARAVTEAIWQRIVYEEYLPALLGPGALGAYAGYRADVDPSAINEWATVAFRFGHDQSNNLLSTLDETGATLGSFTLGQSFALSNAAQAVRTSADIDAWIRGQLAAPTQEIDGKVVDGNRNLLQATPDPANPGAFLTLDLAALDIQRGRDHGVGNLNALREGLGLAPYASLEAYADANGLSATARAALLEVYGPYGIGGLDSIVAGLLERPVAGSMLGETFQRLTVMQFEALRDGDRLFYLNRLGDQPELLAAIERTSLADVLARGTGITHLYRDAFAEHARIGGTDRAEMLRGTGGRDLLIGSGGNDRLLGQDGADDLYGDAGRDMLIGGVGDDLLAGGAGDDMLIGGAGRDVFVFAPGSGRDMVMDFRWSEDQLDVSAFEFASLAEFQARIVPNGGGKNVKEKGKGKGKEDDEDDGGGLLRLDLDGGSEVVLPGLRLADLLASDVILFG